MTKNPIRLRDIEAGTTTNHPTIAAAKKAFAQANGRTPGPWEKVDMGTPRPVWEKGEDRELFAVIWHENDDEAIQEAFCFA